MTCAWSKQSIGTSRTKVSRMTLCRCVCLTARFWTTRSPKSTNGMITSFSICSSTKPVGVQLRRIHTTQKAVSTRTICVILGDRQTSLNTILKIARLCYQALVGICVLTGWNATSATPLLSDFTTLINISEFNATNFDVISSKSARFTTQCVNATWLWKFAKTTANLSSTHESPTSAS